MQFTGCTMTSCCCLIAKSFQTLCNPIDCSPPGSSVHGISQARILEWVAIPFSRGSSWPRNWTCVSCIAGRFFTIWATRETLFTIIESLQRPCVVGNIPPHFTDDKAEAPGDDVGLSVSHIIKLGDSRSWTSVIKILCYKPFHHHGGKWTEATPDLSGWWHISTGLAEWEPIHNLSQKKKKTTLRPS